MQRRQRIFEIRANENILISRLRAIARGQNLIIYYLPSKQNEPNEYYYAYPLAHNNMVVIFSPCDADDMGLDSILFRVYPIILWGITVSCDLCLFIPSTCSIRLEVSLSMLIGFIILIRCIQCVYNVCIIIFYNDYAYS